MHTLMHMYTQPHTHAHATHQYPCTFTHTTPHTCTHNTMCAQDGASSLIIASVNGHDRIVDKLLQAGATVDLQEKVICSSVTRNVMYSIYCTLSTPHNIPGKIKFREHIQQITSADVCIGEQTHLSTGSMYIWCMVRGHTLD